MKIETPKNANYAAVVVRVNSIIELENCDNVAAVPFFGLQAIVSKDVKIGDIGLFFPAETQLSEEFARENNLFRHTNLNADPTQAGYFEDSRRVKAIRFRGHRSDAFFIPLTSLKYIGFNLTDDDPFEVGQTFDTIKGHEICRKYLIKEPGIAKGPVARVRRVDLKTFPEHLDSENYWRNSFKIPEDAHITVTQKLHGTSARFGKIPVLRDLKWYEKIAQRFGVKVDDHEFRLVAGSRRTVKSIDGEIEGDKQHFYASDLWTKTADILDLDSKIPEGFLVYGEIIGWTVEGSPVQKNYTYDMEKGDAEFYIYRVATVTGQGRVVDLSWEQVKTFATENGLKHVPELVSGLHSQFDPDLWIDLRYTEFDLEGVAFVNTPVRLSDPTTVDEGVCVRYDGPHGVYILKAKSPIFLAHESKMLDQEVVDIESEES